MARGGAKRSLEEIVNMSDSADEDWSEGSDRISRRPGRKSQSSPKKKSRPSKKRRRGSDVVSDDASLSDDLSLEESEEDFDDPNVPRNARGTARRRTTQTKRTYEEPSDEEEESFGDDEDGENPEISSPPPKKPTVVTLKIRPEILSQPDLMTRRTTRRTRGASEDMYALTNSGNHMETVERGTVSPETGMQRRKNSRAFKAPVIHEEIVETTEIQASLEILESDVPQEAPEGDTVITNDGEDVEMTNEGVVPESEIGNAKHEEEEDGDDEDDDEGPTTRRRTRTTRNPDQDGTVDAEAADASESAQARRSSRKKPSSQRKTQDEESDFEPEEEGSNDDDGSDSAESTRSPRKPSQTRDEDEEDSSAVGRRPGLRKRPTQSRGHSEVADELAEELDDLRGGRSKRRAMHEVISEKPRRSRKEVDYRLIRPEHLLPIEDVENDFVTESPSRRGRGGGGGGWQRTLFPTYGPFGGGGPSAILAPPGAPAATGGVDSDSSDDEAMQQAKPGGLVPGGLVPQTHSADPAQNLSGTPANFGKVKDKQALADADPLGVDMNVNFDSVGGLQGHIDQLKEMVSLPLLYPEIFQRFHIVPPRGVLFHGPPGTGKTLLARALANSVSAEGRKVTFYMRKGADALSKWVGEAERQLRLLFEEARKTQPSIIFFDEIDGKQWFHRFSSK
jgi:hypothetical protein